MENSSPRDILYKGHLGSIQRKYRRSIDAAAAGRDVVSQLTVGAVPEQKPVPPGFTYRFLNATRFACPEPAERKVPLQVNLVLPASWMLFPPAPATLDVTVRPPVVALGAAVTSLLLRLIDVTSLSL